MALFHFAGFSEAYTSSPEWALANLTTWLVYATFAGAAANILVAWTAFRVQQSEFNRREREEKSVRREVVEGGTDAAYLLVSSLHKADDLLQQRTPNAHPTSNNIKIFLRRIGADVSLVRHYLQTGLVDVNVAQVLIIAEENGKHAIELLEVVERQPLSLNDIRPRFSRLVETADLIRARSAKLRKAYGVGDFDEAAVEDEPHH